MNEELEYAEMLEIPVSTINVVRKKSRRNKNAGLKEKLITRVNNRVATEEELKADAPSPLVEEMEETPVEETAQKGREIETVLLSDEGSENENDAPVSATNAPELTKKERRMRFALGLEFSCVCALCGAIFLTNVFMPTSAINTFFRSFSREDGVKADTRAYSEFAISGVVSEYADTEITISPTGVLTFTDECCVYPAVEGVLASVTPLTDGRYEVKIAHNDKFYSVLSGLDYVYYAEGDEVRSNIPLGYTKGETEVAVTMFSGELPITAYTLGENNALAWVAEK
jgi:hypothetical protein